MLFNIKNLVKTREGDQSYRLLIKNLQIEHGAKIAITGPSGCGKSTTLDILGLSLSPDSAEKFILTPATARQNAGNAFLNIAFNGWAFNRNGTDDKINILSLWQKKRHNTLSSLRLGYMGYILQSGELLPFLTAGENMVFSANLAGIKNALDIAKGLAEKLGVQKLWHSYPAALSVGERQRVAIIRALASMPQVILADEPTAALDPLHADKVMEAFLDVLSDTGSALILVTHNAAWAKNGGFTEIPFRLAEKESRITAILDSSQGFEQ